MVSIYENKLDAKSPMLSPITNNPLRMEISTSLPVSVFFYFAAIMNSKWSRI